MFVSWIACSNFWLCCWLSSLHYICHWNWIYIDAFSACIRVVVRKSMRTSQSNWGYWDPFFAPPLKISCLQIIQNFFNGLVQNRSDRPENPPLYFTIRFQIESFDKVKFGFSSKIHSEFHSKPKIYTCNTIVIITATILQCTLWRASVFFNKSYHSKQ